TATVRLKMPRQGKCVIQDRVCGETVFDWSREQDIIIQRGNGGYVYHLANIVDDYDFQITHVIRGIEHLPNTPRQIFMIEALGYPLPEYAHLPYVAAPGSKEKMSKRKIKDYLKNPEFNRLYEHGHAIA